MISRPTQIAIAVLAVLGLASLPLTIRVGTRIYALHKFYTHSPGARARLAVMPKKRTLTSLPVVHEVDLGYAIFDTGSTDPVSVEASRSGVSVLVKSADVRITFLPPFGDDNRAALTNVSLAESHRHPHLIDFQRLLATDSLAAELQMEETRSVPLARVLRMSDDDFLLYAIVLIEKGTRGLGSNEVQYFEGPNAKGIVLLGESSTDRHLAGVKLYSVDGTRKIGCDVTILPPSSKDIADVIDPIIRSFRFKIGKVGDREVIKTLIQGAGISRKPAAPEDDAENGDESLR